MQRGVFSLAVAALVVAGAAAKDVNCELTAWGAFGACSATCGQSSFKTRSRSVMTAPEGGGTPCLDLMEIKSCDVPAKCPVDCEMAFDDCSICTKTCGGGSKVCVPRVKQQAQNGGAPCPAHLPAAKTVRCHTKPCPVDCKLTQWSKWSRCSASCDGKRPEAQPGVRKRTRAVAKQAKWGGKPCAGQSLVRELACNTLPCKVDCGYLLKQCTPCSKACGGGVYTCEAWTFRKPANGGKACPEHVGEHKCNAQACPEDCVLSKWGKWGSCSTTCNTGVQKRKRRVLRAAKAGGKCDLAEERRTCEDRRCAVDCVVAKWGEWSSCSKTCGSGKTERTRRVRVQPRFGGQGCPTLRKWKLCSTHPCPVDCVVSGWTAVAPCAVTCGGARQTVQRTIKSFAQHGGKACPALAMYRNCNGAPCPKDCKFRKKCGPCSQLCGDSPGTHYCDVTVLALPAGTGKACPQSGTHTCNNVPCPINCEASGFGKWRRCSKTCGGGVATRVRTLRRAAAHGGKPCPAMADTKPCNKQACAADCATSPWAPWSLCSATCGGGTQTSVRTVVSPAAHGGKACPFLAQAQQCNTQPCPRDCKHSSWGAWGACDRTCGKARKTRYRTVVAPAANGGAGCGDLTQHQGCPLVDCPVDCEVSEFKDCTTCSRSCGAGKKRCKRTVTQAAKYGGKACPKLKGNVWCNLQACPADCAVAEWGSWGECTKHCAGGFQKRTRKVITRAAQGGNACPTLKQKQQCNAFPCPVDCVVSLWGDCTACTKSCGVGHQKCFRHVTVPPMYGGRACPTRISIMGCAWTPCPNDCEVTKWSKWSKCTRSCGSGGMKMRNRQVLKKPTPHAGHPCPALLQTKACNQRACPINCEVTPWGQAPWGSCSPCTKSCGKGQFTCTRKVVSKAQHGGKVCPVLVKSAGCNEAACPADCLLKQWGKWTSCSKTCGRGKRSRTRTVRRAPAAGGKACGDLLQEQQCNTFGCPVDCKISSWGSYSACSKSCGHGVITRTRSVIMEPAHDGKPCEVLKEEKKCNTHACPVECEVSPWLPWEACDKSCGDGTQTRSRKVRVEPEDGGKPCPKLRDTKVCNVMDCPVDCAMTEWKCGACAKTCGGSSKVCTREVVRPASQGGRACGALTKAVDCNMQNCPIDCELSQWSQPTPCTQSCGGGKRESTKHIYRYPMWGGKICGPTHKAELCNEQACPIDCVATPWQACSACSKTCGGGSKVCHKKITTAAEHGGIACPQKLKQTFGCGAAPCPVDCEFSKWEAWSPCTHSCGAGTKSRSRAVGQKPLHGGKACPHMDETASCHHMEECPVDCRMSDWGQWSKCSKSCGSGVRKRMRQIVDQSTFGGHRCPAWMATDVCNPQPCAVDCKVSPWSQWSQCSVSCGGGESFRRKELLVLPAYGGVPCDANLMEHRQCNGHKCENAVCHMKHVRCDIEQGHVHVTHDKLFSKVEGDFKCAKQTGLMCANGLFGNAPKNTQCVFPFVYQGKTFHSCIGDAYGGAGWCSTTAMFEGKWGGCKPCTGCQCRCTHHPGCCAHKNYVLKNAMIFANMFKGIKSYHACCGLCTNHPTCGSWEFNSNGVCILKSGKPNFQPNEKVGGGYETWAGGRSDPKSTALCGGDYLDHPKGWFELAKRDNYNSITQFWKHTFTNHKWTAAERFRHGINNEGQSVEWERDANGKWREVAHALGGNAREMRATHQRPHENPHWGSKFKSEKVVAGTTPPALANAVLPAAEAATR